MSYRVPYWTLKLSALQRFNVSLLLLKRFIISNFLPHAEVSTVNVIERGRTRPLSSPHKISICSKGTICPKSISIRQSWMLALLHQVESFPSRILFGSSSSVLFHRDVAVADAQGNRAQFMYCLQFSTFGHVHIYYQICPLNYLR